ncbi:hypothetical protein C1X61_05885 [Pseudomonas sp. FW215-T2]|nr:hypothetical protein PG5_27600 [Pseudomonas sp. G5(2012)]PMZ91108.1 hypothetical protein C1X61_05885 [Pseudomonas sp. FW215-T2]PNA15810.1 hypothetical protein C1X62_04005 [Pseudomonas sp. FW215-R3]PNB38409.1 hypothetical protein C1X63_07710 [Pseudomonas sp. FW305-131]
MICRHPAKTRNDLRLLVWSGLYSRLQLPEHNNCLRTELWLRQDRKPWGQVHSSPSLRMDQKLRHKPEFPALVCHRNSFS